MKKLISCFTLLLLLSFGNGLSITVTIDIIKDALNSDDMEMVLPLFLAIETNLEPLSQVISSKYLGWRSLLSRGCHRWDRKIYKNVRAFVKDHPQVWDHFYDTLCCPKADYLTMDDYRENIKDGLLCGILPPNQNQDEFFTLFLEATNDIDRADPSGYWRRAVDLESFDWTGFFSKSDELIKTRLHRYFGIKFVNAAENHQNDIIDLYRNFALSNVNDESSVASAIQIIFYIVRQSRTTAMGLKKPDQLEYGKSALRVILEALPDKEQPVAQLLEWVISLDLKAPKTFTLPKIEFAKCYLELFKLLAFTISSLDRGGDPSSWEYLALNLQPILKVVSDFDYVELLELSIGQQLPLTKRCEVIIGPARERLLSISPNIIRGSPQAQSCLVTDDLSMGVFNRWYRTLRHPWYDQFGVKFGTFRPQFLVFIPLAASPPRFLFRFETKLLLELIFQKIIIRHSDCLEISIKGNSKWIALLERFNSVYLLLSTFILLKFHYSSEYEIDYGWAHHIVCDGFKDKGRIAAAITFLYGYFECNYTRESSSSEYD